MIEIAEKYRQAINEKFGIDICNKHQGDTIRFPRQIFQYWCKEHTSLILVKIAEMSNKDHASVLNAHKRIKILLDVKDKEFLRRYWNPIYPELIKIRDEYPTEFRMTPVTGMDFIRKAFQFMNWLEISEFYTLQTGSEIKFYTKDRTEIEYSKVLKMFESESKKDQS